MDFTGKLFGKQITIKRITRKKARQLHGKKDYLMQSSRLYPFGFIQPHLVEAEKHEQSNTLFDDVCNNFAFYNCTEETGKRIHFYEIVE